jgi:hypothetical protein
VGTVYKLHLNIASIEDWLPLLCAAGLAALVASASAARTADRRRVRYSGPIRDGRTARDQ